MKPFCKFWAAAFLAALIGGSALKAQTNLGSGTYSGQSYPGDVTLNPSANVTFNSGTTFSGANLLLSDYSTLTLNQGTTLTGKNITFGSAGNYATISVGSGFTLTLGPGTAVTGYIYDLYGNSGSTIINQGSLTYTKASSTNYFYAPTLTNASGGVINVNAGTLNFGYNNGESITNASGGTINVNGSGSVLQAHNVLNQGTVNVSNSGNYEITGTANTTAMLGTINLSTGGRATIQGTLNNSSSTLLAPSGGQWELLNGTIDNGTVAAGALTYTTSGGTLSGVAIAGDFLLPASTHVTFTGGTDFTGMNATISDNAYLNYNQTGTISNKTYTFGTGSSYGQISVGNGDTMTIGSGTTMSGYIYQINGGSGSTIINQGTLNFTKAGSTDYLYAPTLTNASGGLIQVSAGTLNIGYNNGEAVTNATGGTITAIGSGAQANLHNLVNQGTLNAQSSAILAFTGTSNFTTSLGNVVLSSGGRALLEGTFDNTSSTLSAPTGGTYELSGGTINNGTIASGALTYTNTGGTLSGVSITGNFVLPSSTHVAFTGGTDFTGSTATISDNAYLNYNQNGTILNKTVNFGSGGSYGQIAVGAGNTLTIGSGTVMQGYIYQINGNSSSTIVNQGTVNFTQAGSNDYFYAPTLTNASGGLIQVNAGTVNIGYNNGETLTNATGGTIIVTGSGAQANLHNLVNQGTLSAQNGGILEFTGASNLTSSFGNVVLSSGGRALLQGTFDNTSTTILTPSGGPFELYSGTINSGSVASGALTYTTSGGTLNGVTLLGNFVLPNNTHVAFTGGTDFTGTTATISDNAYLNYNQNGTISNKTITFGSGGSYGYLSVGNGNTLTIGSGTTLSGYIYQINGNTGSTVINQGTVNFTQVGSTDYFYAPTLTNASGGLIQVTAGAVNIGYNNGEALTNQSGGTITANGSGAQANLHNLVNQGTLNAQNNGTLEFTGASNLTSSLGNIVLSSGGRALLQGTFDNTASTLNAPTGGSFQLYSGTINGGTIASGALSYTNSGGILNGVSLTGNFLLPANTHVTFTGGTDFTGTNATIADNAYLNYNQNGTIANKMITFGSGGSYGYLSVGSGNTLTIGSGTTMSGYIYQINGNTGSTIINQGTVNFSQASATDYIYAPTLTNASGGLIEVTAGSANLGYNAGENFTNQAGGNILVTGSGSIAYLRNLTNLGTITVANSGAVYFFSNQPTSTLGTVQISSGGHAYLDAVFDNTAATLNSAIGGPWELYSGTISGGSVAAGALSFTNGGGILSGVSLLGDFTMPNNTTVTFAGGTDVGGANLVLGSSSGLGWSQVGTLVSKAVTIGNSGYIQVKGVNNALTIDSGTTVTGTANIFSDASTGTTITNQGSITQNVSTSSNLYARSFVNSGTITATSGSISLGSSGYLFSNTAAGSIVVNGGVIYLNTPVTNNGILNVQSGTLYTNGNLSNGSTGLIQGSGTISGNVAVAGGAIAPGNSIGTLTMAFTNFSVSAPANFNVELGGSTSDKLQFNNPSSNVDIGAGLLSLNLTLLSAPTPATTFTIMQISGGSNTFASGRFAGLPSTGDSFMATYGAQQYDFTVNYLSTAITLNFTPVPEPGTYVLLGGGLLVMGLMLRRKRRKADL